MASLNFINFFAFDILSRRDPVTLIILLALFALAIAMPFFITLVSMGYFRRIPRYIFVLAPILEEIIFRALLIAMLIGAFGPLVAILISTVIYTIYMDLLYGPPFIAEGIVTGLLYGFAFLQFGLMPVIFAHLIYRAVFLLW